MKTKNLFTWLAAALLMGTLSFGPNAALAEDSHEGHSAAPAVEAGTTAPADDAKDAEAGGCMKDHKASASCEHNSCAKCDKKAEGCGCGKHGKGKKAKKTT